MPLFEGTLRVIVEAENIDEASDAIDALEARLNETDTDVYEAAALLPIFEVTEYELYEVKPS